MEAGTTTDRGLGGTSRPELDRLLDWARRRSSTLELVALGTMLVLAAAFLFHETRGTTLWRDEWTWALHRRGNNPGTFLTPHYGHFSLVPIAIYRILFATAGLTHYAPYRVVVIACHLTCVVLIYVYARRRIGGFLGLLAAALLLFLGPASQNIIWPFQIGWLLSLAAGLGALLMLDRRDRLGDVLACVLLGVSLASSGVGIPVALGFVVDWLWTRRRTRDLWIIAVPLALYGIWWLAYQTSQTAHWRQDLWITPPFVVNGVGDSISSLVGLPGPTSLDGPESPLTWGTPLLVACTAAAVWRLVSLRSVPSRVVTLLTMLVAFWALTGLGRAFFAGPGAGRYIYVGAFFVLLLAVELARGVSVPFRFNAVAAGLVALVVVLNVGAYRSAAGQLRSQAQLVKAELGTLEIARPLVKPNYVSQGFLFDEITAGPYFAAEKALGGTPAASAAQIAGYPEVIREAADSQLIALHQAVPQATSAPAPAGGAPPTVDGATGGTVSVSGACARFAPAVGAAGNAELRVTVPSSGIVVTAQGAPATLGLRRFADQFHPLGGVASGASAMLRIGPDAASQPWHLQVAPEKDVSVCALGQA